MSKFLHALHDVDGAELMADKPGWLVVTVAIGHDPHDFSGANFYAWTSRGYSVIVRLNNGYAPAGTIPTPDRYADFAIRCANFVGASPGASFVIIGNEPNHENERPNGQIIYPENYADCYRRCYQQIKARSAAVKVLVAGCAPWDNSSGMDWLDYWRIVLVHCGVCDGFALHTYTHGPDPALITSEEKQHGWHWQFRVYQEQCNAIADTDLDYLPVFLTETDQIEPWLDQDNGWVQAAYGEIDAWNQAGRTPKIHCLALYRSNQDDQWSFAAKNGVKQAFQTVVAKGYTVMSQTPPQPTPTPPEPTPAPEPPRDIDPALYERGVTFDYAQPPAGTWYWRIIYAAWLEDAANQVGPDHHILGEVLRDGVETAGVPLLVVWPSGDTIVTSKADDPGATYNYDYGMSASLNEYDIFVADGNPSDVASGIGMGKDGNAGEHTSTWITFEWTISGDITPPLPTPPGDVETGYVTARAGLNVRSGPATSFPILGTLAYGSTVLWDGSVFDWMHLPQGWVSGEYVEVTAGRGLRAAGAETSGSQPPIRRFARRKADSGREEANSPQPLAHPLPNAVITQNFYENPDYYDLYNLPGHDGVDLAGVPQGTPIGSLAAGIVSRIDYDDGYGNYLMIAHDQLGAYTLYCHASEMLVMIGASVSAGEPIALVGSTGNSSAPHLHLEVREMNADGSYRDGAPMPKGRCDPRTWCFMHGLTL